MKNALCVIAMLAVVASASATVEFFFSSMADPYGLKNPAMAGKATNGNGTDYSDGYALDGIPAPEFGGVDAVVAENDWAYIWGRFRNETNGRKVNGIAISVTGAPAGVGNIAWYRQDNTQDWNLPVQNTRWDGELEVFYFNPAALVAINAGGVSVIPTNNDTTKSNMYYYDSTTKTGTFLLGAVKRPAGVAELTFAFGPIPVNYNSPPNPTVVAMNKVIPEPASLLLIGLAGLFLRRR